MTFTLLVCGGRNYTSHTVLLRVLDNVHAARPVTKIVTSTSAGVHAMARAWAKTRDVEVAVWARNWNARKARIPGVRKPHVLDMEKPDLVIAFPGSERTDRMVRMAGQRGITVQHMRDRHLEEYLKNSVGVTDSVA